MIIASGNIVHNLSDIDFGPSSKNHGTPEAKLFDRHIKNAIEARDYPTLFAPQSIPGGLYSVPSFDHYAPLIPILGAAYDHEKPEWIYE